MNLGALAGGLERALQALWWLLLPALLLVVLGEFAIVVLRYGLAFSRAWLQEAVLLANTLVLLLGASVALLDDQHVRVDVFSRRWSPRARALVEIVGIVLLLTPFALLLLVQGLGYFWAAWQMAERSREPDGLPMLWLWKGTIPLAALLLLLAGLARGLRQWQVWRTRVAQEPKT